MEFPAIIHETQVGNELNAVLKKLSIAPIKPRFYQDFMLCVMSLLQDTVVYENDEPFGTFSMLHDESAVYAIAILQLQESRLGIPVLKVNAALDWPADLQAKAPGTVVGIEANITFEFRRIGDRLKTVQRETPANFPRIGIHE